MSADAIITRDGPVAVPLDYNVPAASEIIPIAISATFADPSSAGPYVPALEVITQTGMVLGPYPLGSSIAAGGSARVSWFPGLGGSASASGVAVVGARIEAHVAQPVPNSTNTDLVYDTVAFDTAGMVNLGADSRKLTVTSSGLYLVICETVWTFNTAGRRLNVVSRNNFYSVDSTSVIGGDTRPAVWQPVAGLGGGAPHTNNIAVAVVAASAGDFFASGCLQASGAALNANGLASGTSQDNFLSAILLGTL